MNKSSASAPPHSLKLELKPKWWKNKRFHCIMSNLSKSPTKWDSMHFGTFQRNILVCAYKWRLIGSY